MARALRVLVVDDNRDMVDTTVAMLTAYGYRTKGCYYGPDALDCVVEFDPDIVLLDLRMPEKNGWDVAAQIRTTLGAARPVIIALTGEPVKWDSKQGVAASKTFDYYLLKPFDSKVLLTLIEQARARRPE